MKKITQLSRCKTRWLTIRTLTLMFLLNFIPIFNGYAQTYCTPSYGTACGFDDDLNSFILTGHGTSLISDIDTGCGNSTATGYDDKTTSFTAVDLLQGQSYPVQINTTYTSPSEEKTSIWIDFNDDGTFDDTTEKLLIDLPLMTAPAFATSSITVPVSVNVGVHRMRVRVAYGTFGVDACAYVNYGEAHDYLVNILPLSPCSGTPSAGTASATPRLCNSQSFTLSVSGYTVAGSMTYQWQSSPQGAGTFTNISGANGVSYTVTNQVADTDYRFVLTCTTSSSTSTSNIVSVAQAAAISNSFFEGFESAPLGGWGNPTVPTCWSYLVAQGSGYGFVSSWSAQTGSRGYETSPSNGTQLLLISPETVNLGNGTKQLRFSVNIPYINGSGNKVEVYHMNGTTGTATKTLIQSIPLKTSGWKEYIVPLPVTTDDYFAISFNGAAGQWPNIYLDDVYYEDLAPCMFPTNIQAGAITITGATVTWNASLASGVTGYEYEVRTSGAPGSGTIGFVSTGIVSAPTTSAPITGLTGATTYYVYVRSVCGTSKGIWTMFPATFDTLCPIFINNFFEGFENVDDGDNVNPTAPLCWTNINTTNHLYTHGTVQSWNANTGSKNYYFYRFPFINAGDGDLMLVSPETANLGNGTKQIRFSAKVPWFNGVTPKLVIYSMSSNLSTATKTLIQAIPINSGTYTEYIVPLPPTTDDYFAFSVEYTNQNDYLEVVIDDVHYEDMTPCIFPLNLQVTNITTNTITISWDASLGTGVTGYEYEIRTSGAAGSGATGLAQTGVVNAPGTSINITGLNHSTVFTVYIRSKCGTSNGIWTTFPVKFNTLCDVVTNNFFEGFENTDVGSPWSNPPRHTVPLCWSYFDINDSGYGYTNDWNQRTGNRGFYIYNYGNTVALISPETNNLGSGTKRVRFWARKPYGSGVDLGVYTMNGTTSAATKTLMKNIPLTDTWTEYTVYFPVSTTDDYFAFISDAVSGSADINIDDIYYEDAPSCKPIEDSTIKVTNIGKSSFTVSWQDLYNANPVAYEVEVRTTGNPGTPGAVFNGTTAIGVTTLLATGLNSSTDYKVYVRSVCSATEQSDWSGAVAATTLCNYSDFISYTPSLALCGPQKAELSAVLVDPTAMAAWYDNENDAVPLFEGPDFISDTDVTQDRSFWLRSRKTTPDTPVQLGNGTGSSNWELGQFLYYGYGGMRHQYIFTADELTQAGLTAGPISALKFDVVSTGTNPRPDFSIAIGTTANNTAAMPLVSNSLLTQVYAPVSQTFSSGVNTLTFNTSYVWDGVSNLVVQTNWSSNDWGASGGAVKYHQTATNKTSVLYGYNVSASTLLATDVGVQWTIYASTSNQRPNIVFVGVAGCVSPAIEIPVTVSDKPAFDISSTSTTSCEGSVTTTPVTITTNLGGYDTFVWTPSTGVTGDAVNGWTFSTAQEQDYTLVATQSTGICKVEKTVRVFAGKKPEVNAALASTYDLCKDEVAELKALETLPASVTIGSGLTTTASTSEVSAFIQSALYSKQQYIYSAAELLAQGLTTSGYITNLSFETINSGASLSNPKYTIKMMLTPNTAFGTTNFETGNLSTVYSKVNHTHTFQGTQTMIFDSPFYWDGQSNILVEITQEGAGAGNNAQTYFTSVAGVNTGMYATSATDPNPVAGARTTDRLNAKFGLQQSTVTWSPSSNLYLDAAANVPYTSGTNALKVYVRSSVGLSQVYNAALTAPLSGCTLDKAITVNITDVITPVVQNQTFCSVTPVTSVIVTSGPTATFNFYNSATATTPITTVSQTGTYYVEAIQGLCKSVRVPFTATITPLALPTAQFTQVVCGGGTVSSLIASGVNGSQIRWYASATATTPLAGTQALVDNTTYYASQTLGTCESGRISVLVDINPAPAALTPQTISICGSLNYGGVNLNQISGSELVWYPSATSQTPIPNTGQIVNGTYYVSQKVNGCESLRVQIIASSQGSVAAPTAGVQNICGSGTVAQLIAQILPNATAEWYSNATSTTPLASTAALVNGTYYLSQRVGNCVSVKVPVAVRVISTSAPAISPISMCAGSTVGDLSIPATTGTSYTWYLNSTSITPLPLTDVLKSGYYFVTRVDNGCESVRTQVQITINSRPNSPTGASPQTFTDYAEISNLIMTQPNVVWYVTYDDAMKGDNPLAGNMPLVNGTTYYAVIIGANGCPSLPTPIEAIIVLGVNDFDLSKLKYYPNPVNDLLTITYTDAITNVEVFDLNGRMVITRNFDNQTVQLDFSSLSAGTYMLNIKTKENSQFVKIVKK